MPVMNFMMTKTATGLDEFHLFLCRGKTQTSNIDERTKLILLFKHKTEVLA